MSCRRKKIKLEPDIVKEEPQQEEGEEKDGMYSFEEVLEATREENAELEPEHFFIKTEIEEEQVDVGGDFEEINKNLDETCDASQSLYTEDNAKSKYTTTKLGNSNKPRKAVRDFLCTICNYATKKLIDFTKHWLSHEKQSYTNENGVFVCQISDCFYLTPNQEDLLKHIASQHLYRYRCDFCYYVTFSKSDYDQHRTTHYTYQCVKCDLQSTKHFFVQDHVETPLKCTLCDFTAYHWFPYKKHINWHEYLLESIVECGFCDFTTGDEALLEKHKSVHSTKSMPCKMCRFTGLNTEDLAKHWMTAHDTTLEAVDKLHKCKYCTCKFIALGSKEKHEELHLKSGASFKCCSNSTTVQCPYCEHLENQRDDMYSHILSDHTAALELDGFRIENTSDEIASKGLVSKNLDDCDIDIDECMMKGDKGKHEVDQETNTEDTPKYKEKTVVIDDIAEDLDGRPAKRTRREAKRKSELIFGCTYCQFKTIHKTLYDLHLTIHHSRRYTCSLCYFVTSSKEDYDVHCRQHSTFKCNKCPFESTKRLFVEDHIENPWGCAKCNFKTHHWLPMKNHSFSHQNQAQTLLKCNDCDFETRRAHVLKAHILTHKAILLRCKVCLYKTKSENELHAHYAQRHDGILSDDDRPYECDLCDCKFKQQVYLDKHRTLHGENGPFRFKCSQCHQTKKMPQKVEKKNRKEGAKHNSWSECPYCSYEDEVRYRMIEHLSQIHQNELEIEGFRFDDCQSEKIIPHTATSIENVAAKMTSSIELPQDVLSTTNTDKTVEDRQNEDVEFGMEIKKNTSRPRLANKLDDSSAYLTYCSVCNFSSDKGPEYIRQHIIKEHVQRVYRCNICGFAEKEMHLINEHMHKEHPPLTSSNTDGTDNTILSCAACGFSAKKRKCVILIHMFNKHVTKEESEGSDFSQINPYYFIGNHTNSKYGKRTFTCNICGCVKKEKHVIQEHIETQHPPLTDDANKEKMFLCPVCRYPTKKKCISLRHMYAKHVTEVTAEENAVSQITDRKQPKNEEEIERSEYDAYQHNSIEEDIHRPIEQIVIKVETTDEGDTTSEDHTGCSNSEDNTQIEQGAQLTSKLVPIYIEEEKRWCCPVCRYTVLSSKDLVAQHIDQVHIGDPNLTWPCKTCPYRSKQKAKLRQHVALMHRAEYRPKVASEEIPCKQPGCKFKAPTVDELSMHMARHLQTSMQQVMVYKCEVCSFGTVSKTIFRDHQKSCFPDPMWYYCYNCDFKSESKKGVWFHIDKKHRYMYTREKGNVCRKCGFSSKDPCWKEYHHIYCGIRGSEY